MLSFCPEDGSRRPVSALIMFLMSFLSSYKLLTVERAACSLFTKACRLVIFNRTGSTADLQYVQQDKMVNRAAVLHKPPCKCPSAAHRFENICWPCQPSCSNKLDQTNKYWNNDAVKSVSTEMKVNNKREKSSKWNRTVTETTGITMWLLPLCS